MNKLLTLTLAATMLLASLTSCRMPEKKDPFKEILEENPDMELPKSEIMEVDPEDIPIFEINDTLSNYEEEMTFDIPALGDHAAGKLIVKYQIYDFAYEDRNVAGADRQHRRLLRKYPDRQKQVHHPCLRGLCRRLAELLHL